MVPSGSARQFPDVPATRVRRGHGASADHRTPRSMMIMSPEEALAVKLERLRAEHRDLDAAIDMMAKIPVADQLAMRRLKKRKLSLKDEISRLVDRLIPDIIA
ncbi:MAG: hypothetical protein ACJAVR_002780 [Paracoccaceae bacterium]